MLEVKTSSLHSAGIAVLLGIALLSPICAHGEKKKKASPADSKPRVIDYSNIVWPNPPAVARIKYQAFYAAEKVSQLETENSTKKAKWMDRLAGSQPQTDTTKVLWQLAEPYGLAVDSKNNLYVADQKVGAIFIFNTETRDLEMIKNQTHAHFGRIIGLAMDDDDRLFVSDPQLRHVLVFDKDHKPIDVITDGLAEPGGMAIDRENRLLYVADVKLDQVLVYDADTLKLLRKMGTTGRNHELTSPGDFAKPGGMAVDKDGNLYVADTLNDRIEIFDADGQFIRAFGKNGDGPGYFGRPKGVAIDGDGHIWVADGMQDPRPGLQPGRPVTHLLRGARAAARTVPGACRHCLRQEQPGVYLRDLLRTGAAVSVCERCGSRTPAATKRRPARKEARCPRPGSLRCACPKKLSRTAVHAAISAGLRSALMHRLLNSATSSTRQLRDLTNGTVQLDHFPHFELDSHFDTDPIPNCSAN